MYCPKCGRRNPRRASFCIECGRSLAAQASTPPSRRRRRGGGPGLLIGLLGAIALVLVLLFAALLATLLLDGENPEFGEDSTAPEETGIAIVLATATAGLETRTSAPQEIRGVVTPPALPKPKPVDADPTATLAAEDALPTTATPAPSMEPTLPPTPSATPRPANPSCRYAERGTIGFKRQQRCNAGSGNACGPVEIWVMDADGSNQAPMCNKTAYEWGLLRDRTSPDGAWRVEVTERQPDIYRLWLDTGQREMIIVNNRKDWDPALSADGWWLAWVTNRNANDEIYVKTLDPRDQNQRRLTENAWEWDKHPTWSPDGRRIAFYSNRGDSLGEATRQIWVMAVVDDRGVDLRNLSNRPDRVDTDPVWYKWDNIPR